MKTILTLAGSFLAIVAVTVNSPGQSFSIDWFTIDGGGGISTGGDYALSGSIGQPDAGAVMSGGAFDLTGGFWSAVETAGVPRLRTYLTNGNRLVVLWPSPSIDFVLQQNGSLSMGSWAGPSETIADDGTNKFIIVNPPAGIRFYRLFRP